jgi:predicted transcriptional regulator
MKRTNTGTIDLDTGELLEGNLVLLPKRLKYCSPFVMIFQDYLDQLDLDDLGLEALKVLFYMLRTCDFENEVPDHAAAIARSLGLKPTAVSRAIKKLLHADLISVRQTVGQTKFYSISECLCWKGRIKNQILRSKKDLTTRQK